MSPCRDERAGGRLSPVPEGEAPTVGNSPDGFVGEMPVPAIVEPETGRVGLGVVGLVIGVLVGLGEAVAETTSVAVPEYELAPGADTLADSCQASPDGAEACTCAVTSSSSAWPTIRPPT
jgi:hypothetical protein